MTNREKLRLLGEALHGPRWMRATAADLGINYRTVLRWDAGEYSPSLEVIGDLLAIARRRRAQIDAAIEVAAGEPSNKGA